ncbi:MFS transporter, FSR family, fosmidomycin resistance protein [Humidesulfovibrio mexicanus]|uniref:MFS transporter, FSR family, fosmidomycin resistance protein n=1 Tax=Humidesulfovibrio mexicanus TaxID=147047 RepID=A0A239C465_9BACT|nr:MFS transporter [Humidesulfovibrio mexicanus]SNS14930.1 MFS transporter, FSR family, fosmidomycin resistance protein [Humidesulfovibrio mexicanus]
MAGQPPRLKPIVAISLAHLVNDWYMNFIQTLLPFLVAAGMSVGRGGFLISAFTLSSSVLQPVFGYLVDRKNQRWMVYVGTIWMAIMLSLLGVTDNYAALFAFSLFSGLGTAAFHPQAAAMIGSVSGNRHGLFQAVFAAAGNIGWALTPLIAVPFIVTQGLSATPVLVIPGIAAAAMLLTFSPKSPVGKKGESVPFRPLLREHWRELLKIVFVVALRSLTYFGIIAFLPLFLQERGVTLVHSGQILFVMLFAGALGGLVGGHLSDRLERRGIIIVSLILAAPLFHLALHAEGLARDLLLALGGAALLASFSVTVVLAQEVLRKNAAMASGLTLGFGNGIGGLGVGLVGMLIERYGLGVAMHLIAWLPLVAGILAASIKRRALSAEQTAAAAT